jgi:hypothetical protein
LKYWKNGYFSSALGLAQFYSTGPNPPGQPAHRPFSPARARLGVVPTARSATARRAIAVPIAASCLSPPRATHAACRVQHSEPMSGRWRPACTIAARSPATSRRHCRPTLLTSRHLRSTRCTCSHRPCTLPPHRQSGGKVIHSSSHSYHRAPATPLEPPSPSCLSHRRSPPLVLLRPHLLHPEHRPSPRDLNVHFNATLDPFSGLPPTTLPRPSTPSWRATHGEPPAAFCLKSEPPSPGGHSRAISPPTNDGRLTKFHRRAAGVGGGGGFPSSVSSAGPKHRGNRAV